MLGLALKHHQEYESSLSVVEEVITASAATVINDTLSLYFGVVVAV
eukprot:COSAG02_NODE_11506_length_1710_cov_4.997236_1_plen_45_part_10